MFAFEMYSINLALWILSVVSGTSAIYYYWISWIKEKRLPLATEYSDLDARCKIKEAAYKTLVDQISDLENRKAERDYCISEVEQMRFWLDSNKNELLKVEGERILQESLRLANTQLQKEYNENYNQLNKAQLDSDLALRTLRDTEEKTVKQKEKNKELISEERNLEDNLTVLRLSHEKITSQISQLKLDEVYVNDSINRLKEELKAYQNQKEIHDRIILEIQRCESKCENLAKEIQELSDKREHLRNEETELLENVMSLGKDKEELQKQLKVFQKNFDEIKKDYNIVTQDRERAISERNVARQELESYQLKINTIQKNKGDDQQALEDLTKPYITPKTIRKEHLEEDAALKNLEEKLKKNNLFYSQRLLYSFHTGLKINDISPLVVLSGISGTGKSQLPRQYASAMGIHFLNIAVQPRWDNPQDIFGFYNYLEGRYKSTELTRLLIQADRYNRNNWSSLKFNDNYPKLDNQMALVLFDEMNLARVEYYFSEFLSKLEMRRGINLQDSNERMKAEIVLDVGKLQKGGQDMRLYVDQNILFVGTMNEDESTQSLSDKILDRANMMRFGKPTKLSSTPLKQNLDQETPILTFDNWNSWIKDPSEYQEREKVEERVIKLNNAMELLGRSFGHRVSQAILSYVANYPVENGYEIALSDQIEQRIMPKLRNVACKEHDASAGLEQIEKIIAELNDDSLHFAFEKSREGEFFDWKGVDRS